MKAVIYTRVNQSKGTDTNKRLSVQKNEISKYCKKYRIQVIKFYSDICGAIDPSKPGLEALLHDLKSGRVNPDFLVCQDLSRIARTGSTIIKVISDLNQNNVMIKISCEEGEMKFIQELSDLLGVPSNPHSYKIKAGIAAKKERMKNGIS